MKIKKLNAKYPVIGYGIFFRIVELLYQSDGKLEYDLDFLAMELNYDKETIKRVVEDFELFNVTDQVITNRRVTEGLREITEKSGKAKASADARWNR